MVVEVDAHSLTEPADPGSFLSRVAELQRPVADLTTTARGFRHDFDYIVDQPPSLGRITPLTLAESSYSSQQMAAASSGGGGSQRCLGVRSGRLGPSGRGAAAWGDVRRGPLCVGPDVPVLERRPPRVRSRHPPRHGGSRPWEGHLGHERLMGVLASVFAQLGLTRFSVVGLSMGGGLAIESTAARPERVTSMALFEPGGLGTRLDQQFLTWLYVKTPGTGRLLNRAYHRKSSAALRKTLDSLYVGGSQPTDPDRLVAILKDEIKRQMAVPGT